MSVALALTAALSMAGAGAMPLSSAVAQTRSSTMTRACALTSRAAHGRARCALGSPATSAQHVLLLGLIGAFHHNKQAFRSGQLGEDRLVRHETRKRLLIVEAEEAQVLHGALHVDVGARHAHDGAPAVQAQPHPRKLTELDARRLLGESKRGRARTPNGQASGHELDEVTTGESGGRLAGTRGRTFAIQHAPALLDRGRLARGLAGYRDVGRPRLSGTCLLDASHGCLGESLGHALIGKQLVYGLFFSGVMHGHPRAFLSCFLPRATHEYTVFTGTPIIFATSPARYPSHTVRYKA